MKKEDGRVKLLVYRRKSHTDQYLHFTSHHPLQHKLGVIYMYTLFNRCKDVVTEETDRKEEEDKICTALELCGYPKWSFQQVRSNIKEKAKKSQDKKEKSSEKSRGQLVSELVAGRVDPRVGPGRVGSGRVMNISKFRGSGRVGSAV